MSMPKEWTDKIKAQGQQKELEADKIHNLPKEFEHQHQEKQQKKQKDARRVLRTPYKFRKNIGLQDPHEKNIGDTIYSMHPIRYLSDLWVKSIVMSGSPFS